MTNTNLLKYTGGSIVKSLGTPEEVSLTRDVSGYYTSATVDLHGHIIDKSAMLGAIEDFKQWGTIRLMHEDPIGQMKSICVPDWNMIEASVTGTPQGDSVLTMVREGIYKAFSVGLLVNAVDIVDFSSVSYEEFDGLNSQMIEYLKELGYVVKVTGLTLIEVSIVDRPANPLARMQSVSKMINGDVSVLPSVTQKDAIGMIQNAIGAKTVFHVNNGLLIPNNAKKASNTESIMENEKDVVAEEVVDTPVEETTETVAAEPVEKNVESDLGVYLLRFEKAFDTIEQINTAVASLSENVQKNVFDADAVAQSIAKQLGETFFKSEGVSAPAEEAAVEEPANAEATLDKSVLDVLTKAIADEFSKQRESDREERKGTVNTPAQTEKAEGDSAVNVKAMDRTSLKGFIVDRIASSL
jgi:hypothetical protein